MKRNETKIVKIGNLTLGGNDKIYIQSMTTTKTKDIASTVPPVGIAMLAPKVTIKRALAWQLVTPLRVTNPELSLWLID
jgi:hypothetical protein